jgi:hypothetical protein
VTYLVVSLVAVIYPPSPVSDRARQWVDAMNGLASSSSVLMTYVQPMTTARFAHWHAGSRNGFALDYVMLWLPAGADFDRHEAGTADRPNALKTVDLHRALGCATQAIEPAT